MLRRRVGSNQGDAPHTWHAGVSPSPGDATAPAQQPPAPPPSVAAAAAPVSIGGIPAPFWQLLVGLLSWVAFAGGWVRVVRMGTPDRLVLQAGALLLATLVVITVATAWWVRHNLAIYRRKGPRRAVPVAEAAISEDRLGRPLTGPLEALTDASEIVIELKGGEKWYSRA